MVTSRLLFQRQIVKDCIMLKLLHTLHSGIVAGDASACRLRYPCAVNGGLLSIERSSLQSVRLPYNSPVLTSSLPLVNMEVL